MITMRRDKYYKVEYYTLEDLVKEALIQVPNTLKCGFPYENTLKDILENIMGLEIPQDSPVLTTLCNKLFCQYIYPKRHCSYCAWAMADDYEQKIEVMRAFCESFIAIVCDTYDKFSTLIGIAETEQHNLMNGIITKSTIRHNDTPQNGGEFSDDSYTSDFSTHKMESDGETKIGRIDQIARLLKNYYSEWAKEFNVLFEVNADD